MSLRWSPLYCTGFLCVTSPNRSPGSNNHQDVFRKQESESVAHCCCLFAPHPCSLLSVWRFSDIDLSSIPRCMNGNDGSESSDSGGPGVFVPHQGVARLGCVGRLCRRRVWGSGGGSDGECAATPEQPGLRDERSRWERVLTGNFTNQIRDRKG